MDVLSVKESEPEKGKVAGRVGLEGGVEGGRGFVGDESYGIATLIGECLDARERGKDVREVVGLDDFAGGLEAEPLAARSVAEEDVCCHCVRRVMRETSNVKRHALVRETRFGIEHLDEKREFER
jgi:hypothetical protein